MIRKADAVKVVKASGLRGGKGEVEMRQLLEADKDEFNGKGRLFAHNVLSRAHRSVGISMWGIPKLIISCVVRRL